MFNSTVDVEVYRKNFTKIKEKVLELGRKSCEHKNAVLVCFGEEKWSQLSISSKEKHSIFDCKACIKDEGLRQHLSLFPISKKDLKGKKRATEGGLFKPSTEAIQKETSELITGLNSKYKKDFGTTFDCQYRICKGLKTKSEVLIVILSFLIIFLFQVIFLLYPIK